MKNADKTVHIAVFEHTTVLDMSHNLVAELALGAELNDDKRRIHMPVLLRMIDRGLSPKRRPHPY